MRKTFCEFLTPQGGTKVIPDKETFELDELQKAVGGHIEMITLPHNLVLIVNEDGASMRLPVNPTATQRVRSITGREDVNAIFGNAIICERELIK